MTMPTLFDEPPAPAPTDGRLPAWLVEHIRLTTGRDPGGRNAHTHRCPDCRLRVISGPDDEWCSIPVTVDPTPLSPQGEALAHLTDRSTYALRRISDRIQLTHRDHWQIEAKYTGTPTNTGAFPYDIVAAHKCINTHSLELPNAPSRLRPRSSAPTDDGPPPF